MPDAFCSHCGALRTSRTPLCASCGGELDTSSTVAAPAPVPGIIARQPRTLLITLLAKFGLGSEHVDRPARSLSLGERTRAMLAIFQAREVNVLVLDEPTNHLDVPAIEQLETALADFPGTLVVVSHDRAFLDRVGIDRTLDLGTTVA